MQSTNNSIPHVDMRRYDEDFQAFTKDVGNGYEEYGFIALTNHGVDTQLIERALDIYLDQINRAEYISSYRIGSSRIR